MTSHLLRMNLPTLSPGYGIEPTAFRLRPPHYNSSINCYSHKLMLDAFTPNSTRTFPTILPQVTRQHHAGVASAHTNSRMSSLHQHDPVLATLFFVMQYNNCFIRMQSISCKAYLKGSEQEFQNSPNQCEEDNQCALLSPLNTDDNIFTVYVQLIAMCARIHFRIRA